jgi:hypothetical protein
MMPFITSQFLRRAKAIDLPFCLMAGAISASLANSWNAARSRSVAPASLQGIRSLHPSCRPQLATCMIPACDHMLAENLRGAKLRSIVSTPWLCYVPRTQPSCFRDLNTCAREVCLTSE